MKEKVKVGNKWKYRLFVIQLLSVFITILLIIGKFMGMGISWLGCFYPIIFSIGLPLAVLTVGLLSGLTFFGLLYLFSKKENKKKLKDAFKKVKWKR